MNISSRDKYSIEALYRIASRILDRQVEYWIQEQGGEPMVFCHDTSGSNATAIVQERFLADIWQAHDNGHPLEDCVEKLSKRIETEGKSAFLEKLKELDKNSHF